MLRYWCALILASLVAFVGAQNKLKVNVEIAEPEVGRLLLLFSKDFSQEPRFQITDDYRTQIAFGYDIESGKTSPMYSFPSQNMDSYPIESWQDLAPGEYQVQAILNRYEMFNLQTGHNVWLPPDMGEGQKWNIKPLNMYSVPVKVIVGSGGVQEITLKLDQSIAPLSEPKNTVWIRHIKIRSEKLSRFWGREVYLGAHVLIPRDWENERDKKYPLMIFHGHFPSDFSGFRTSPPDPSLDNTEYSDRFKIYGYKKIQQQEGYDFYKKWTSKDFPKFIAIEIQHPTPYYDDSYAVNSACQGPYGDAITYELIPFIEKEYRGIGAKGRFLYGGSTGGWEALAAQVFYPDEYNGCFAACPDPIDFRAYCTVNIYDDQNAYYTLGSNTKILKPAKRDYLGHISSSMEMANRYEAVLGSRSRSGQQWDIWEATYSPMDKDGYPQRIFDKKTGEINKTVAAYWKENYDLVHIMKRDWAKLGPKLEGKIHLYCGDMDNYYLNNAVYLAEEFLNTTTNPYYKGEVKYGDRAEHCWNGDPSQPNYLTRLRYHTMYLDRIKTILAKNKIAF